LIFMGHAVIPGFGVIEIGMVANSAFLLSHEKVQEEERRAPHLHRA
jgi:hypothetical protein